jgi:hypothetical protein
VFQHAQRILRWANIAAPKMSCEAVLQFSWERDLNFALQVCASGRLFPLDAEPMADERISSCCRNRHQSGGAASASLQRWVSRLAGTLEMRLIRWYRSKNWHDAMIRSFS